MNGIEVLCFDIGGTLIDCGPSFAKAIERLAGRTLLRWEWDCYVNLADGAVEEDLVRLAEGLGTKAENVVAAFQASRAYRRRLFPDVMPSLRHLAPLRCVALSNAARWTIDEGLLGAESFIEQVFYSYAIGHSKPDHMAFDHVARALDTAPSRILMIGDSLDYDCRGALAAGWQALLVDRDASASSAAYPILSIRTLEALPALLARGALGQSAGR